MHYYIISILIAGIVIFQFSSFLINKKKLSLFKNVFPDDQNKFQLVADNTKLEIKTQHNNYILEIIISSINNYLTYNNGAVSDYHLIKDTIDRNCDTKEEEIQTEIPIPLYLGLVGTMLGILIGVGFLVFGGGLTGLLNSGSGSSSEGIETLLGGVTLAMISSIIGILLTTSGSHRLKNAKTKIEKNKNNFLSWIQANLLPNISSDTSSALVRMTQNLSNFNNTFTQNTHNLKEILSHVTESYQKQKELMQYVNRLKIADIATANIDVYDRLKNSTNEIGVFAKYLKNSNEYLSNIQSLNRKLDEYERRTQIIESAGMFFTKNEKWLAENFDIANLEVKSALERFRETTEKYLQNLQESLSSQILNFDNLMHLQQQKLQESLKITTEIVTETFIKTQQTFEKAISDQQLAFHSKYQETSKLVEELKNLTHIKEGIKDFKEATNRQNTKIDELASEIRILAQIKTEGGTINQTISFPKRFKILIIAASILFTLSCLFYICPFFIEWITKLVNWLS